MDKHELQSWLEGKSLKRAGTNYFSTTVVEEVLLWCERNQVPVIGVEGFELLEENEVKPRLDLIADYSDLFKNKDLKWSEVRRKSTLLAGDFFNDLYDKKNLVFDLVLRKDFDEPL